MHMKQKVILIAVIAIVAVLTVYFSIQLAKENNKVCFNNSCFNVEIAKTEAERAQGLMYQDYLAEYNGMLFIFQEEGIYSVWMKNTQIPLDIVWINKNKEVVYIKENAQPCAEQCPYMTPDKPAMYVLEINSGLSKSTGINVGKILEFHISDS